MRSVPIAQAGEPFHVARSRARSAPRTRATRSSRAAGKAQRRGAGAQALCAGDKRRVVDAFITVLEGLYAHLPLKRARYGVDPVQRLRLLRGRSDSMPDPEFHSEMGQILTELRDAHTRYQGAGALAGKVAVLPFLLESYGPGEAPRYVVSNIGPAELVGDPAFTAGVEVLSWSGAPIDHAVSRWADSETGGRPDARRARALETLTFRSLEFGPAPDEEWVIIGYRSEAGEAREVRMPWRVVEPGVAATASTAAAPPPLPSGAGARGRSRRSPEANLARNPAAEAVRRAKQLLFAKRAWDATRTRKAPAARGPSLAARQLPNGDVELPSTMPDVLAAMERRTASGPVGYLRIWSFSVKDDVAFVEEVIRLVEQLPESGLIIDLRGNPGGLIWAAERTLQLFTPRPIAPVRFSWLATDLTRAMAGVQPDAAAWADSLQAATSTGEQYSQPRPITDPEECNDIGQRYAGPVVAVVDANTYSAGDIFAAGFVDNQLGRLLCVGEATGAGGANVWNDALVREALAGTPFELDDLPGGVRFTLAVRRVTRTADAEGIPIEDLGVPGDSYAMTRDDLLHGNRDLVDRCAEHLAAQPHTSLKVVVKRGALTVTTRGLDTIDLLADGHAWRSVKVKDGRRAFAVPGRPAQLDVVGWAAGEVVQRRRLRR